MEKKRKDARMGERNVCAKRANLCHICDTTCVTPGKSVSQTYVNNCAADDCSQKTCNRRAKGEREAGVESRYPTVNVVFDHRGVASRSHAGAVEIRVGYMRRRIFIGTGIRLLSHQWRAGKIVNHAQSVELTRVLNRLYGEVSARIAELWDAGEFALKTLRDSFRQARASEDTASPVDWMRGQLSVLPLREGTRRHHASFLDTLERSGLFARWSDFVPGRLTTWDAWVRRHTGARCDASVFNYHKRLKMYLGRAVVAGLIPENPYKKVKFSRGASSRPRYLTSEERRLIEEATLVPVLSRVRDVFVVMMYTGLAYSDVAKLSRDKLVRDGGRLFLVDERRKTGTPYRLLLLPQVVSVLERYDYALPIISNQKMNLYLREIGELLGIVTPITSHVGRHTFATWALSQGVPIEVVSKMLAHTDIKTTQIYARVLQEDVTRGFELLAGR